MNTKQLAAVAAVAGGALLVWLAYRYRNKLNPASTENIIYSGVNAIGDSLDNDRDDASFSLGAWIYDITHPYDGFEYSPQWQNFTGGR